MKIIIGAGGRTQKVWISTEQGQLDLLCENDFIRILNGAVGYECMVAEHIYEHISPLLVINALSNCYKYLSPNGRLRIAVPDGFHPDKDYIDYVKPGGTGAGASDHKELYNYHSLSKLLKQVGFRVELLEWWDENKKYHAKPWYNSAGYLEGSHGTS